MLLKEKPKYVCSQQPTTSPAAIAKVFFKLDFYVVTVVGNDLITFIFVVCMSVDAAALHSKYDCVCVSGNGGDGGGARYLL